MMRRFDPHYGDDDVTDQVFRLLDGTLDDDAAAALYRRLEDDAAARRVYRRCVNLYAALPSVLTPAPGTRDEVRLDDDDLSDALEGAGGSAGTRSLPDPKSSALCLPAIRETDDLPEPVLAPAPFTPTANARGAASRRRRGPWLAAAAASVLLVAWLAGWLPGRSPARATLAAAIDAEWETGGLTPGTALPSGTVVLRSGVVKLSFADGAQVVVAGPARFAQEPGGSLLLERGMLSAVVPSAAAGFTVRTPTARLVDLGTEFVVEVRDGEGTRMNVVAGSVAVTAVAGSAARAAPTTVAAGSAVRVAPRSAVAERMAQSPIPVPRVSEMDAWSSAHATAAYRRWADSQAALAGRTALDGPHRADLLFHYDFESLADGRLTGASGAGPVAGRVVGDSLLPAPGPFAAAGSGLRMPGADGYAHLGNHRSVGEGGGLTLAAWVRPTATNGFGYVLSTGLDATREWEVYLRLNNGLYEAGLGVEGYSRDHKRTLPVPPEDIGQWVHIAAVYDNTGWRIYRNGQTSMSGGGDPNMLSGHLRGPRDWYAGARVRQAGADAPLADRFFKGDIDDVRVYAAPLTAAEVAALASGRL